MHVCVVSRRYIHVYNSDVLVWLICTFTIQSYMLSVLMVESIYVAVNVMLSLKSVMSPPPDLCDLSVVKLCTLGFLALWATLVSCIVIISACVS